jgi:hypothetical protein
MLNDLQLAARLLRLAIPRLPLRRPGADWPGSRSFVSHPKDKKFRAAQAAFVIQMGCL